MEVIQRILRVIRANFNSLISNAEDPEKILETAFMEMQENLVQLRQGVAQAIATQSAQNAKQPLENPKVKNGIVAPN